MFPILARASSALALGSGALLLEAALELLLDELDEPDEPDELEVVDADDDAVEELDSPALSVDVCDAVSQAATKKATAASAIRRCNMVMLPVLKSGLSAIRLSGCCPVYSPVLTTVALSRRCFDRFEAFADGRMKTSLVVPGTPGPTNLVTYYRKFLIIETKTPFATIIS